MGSTSRQAGDGRPLVLVVEGEVFARLELAAMLEEGGYQPVPVVSAEEALEVLEAVPGFAALVTDVGLAPEGLDGYALARQVRERWGIGVVVVSGPGALDDDKLPPGVYFLAKPIHEWTLLQLVHMAIHGSAQVPDRPAAPAMAPETMPEEASGAWHLTPRQRQVLELIAQGKSNRAIAQELGLSENTVRVHAVSIFKALRVSNRVKATLVGLGHLNNRAHEPSRVQDPSMGSQG
jgi:DNA-binding NarL/FixJ family response regulator